MKSSSTEADSAGDGIAGLVHLGIFGGPPVLKGTLGLGAATGIGGGRGGSSTARGDIAILNRFEKNSSSQLKNTSLSSGVRFAQSMRLASCAPACMLGFGLWYAGGRDGGAGGDTLSGLELRGTDGRFGGIGGDALSDRMFRLTKGGGTEAVGELGLATGEASL